MSAKRPNVLFVFADQLRASAVGCYRDEEVQTPRLDAFAQEGVRFPVAIASVPLCGPYRASLLTGMHATNIGAVVNDVPLRDDPSTLGELFAAAGYETAYVGKWHLDGPDRVSPVPSGRRRRGFAHWAAANFEHNYTASKYFFDADPVPRIWPGYDAQAQTDWLLRFLEGRASGGQPFLAVLSWGPPHNPYRMVPAQYLDAYDPQAISRRPNAIEFPREDLWGYYAQISFIDAQFGRVLDALGRLGLENDTLVVFTSDHGDMHGSHGVYKKGWPWDESVRVPMMMRWPGHLDGGEDVAFPISTVDILPTLLGLCGLRTPAGRDGLDLSGALLRNDVKPESVLIANPCPAHVLDPRGEDMVPTFRGRRMEYRGVRTMRHTYIETLDGPWLLYDNEVDPFQLDNLVDEPAHADARSQLQTELAMHLGRAGDRFEPKEAYYARFKIDVDERGLKRGVVKNPYPANL